MTGPHPTTSRTTRSTSANKVHPIKSPTRNVDHIPFDKNSDATRSKPVEDVSESTINNNSENNSHSNISTTINYRNSICQICDERIVIDDPVNCIRCNLSFHVQCCMSDEVHQLLCVILENKISSGSIGYECQKCSQCTQNIATQEYVASKLSNFEITIQKKIDNIENNIAKKMNLAYAAKKPDRANNDNSDPADKAENNKLTGYHSIDTNLSEAGTSNVINNSPAIVDNTEPSGDASTPPQQVCNHYKRGKCRHGANGKKLINNRECKFMHPRKCRNYCRFGRDGCDSACGQLHPVLCRSSVRFRKCFDESCTLAHLLGTERQNSQDYQPRYDNHASYINREQGHAHNNDRGTKSRWSKTRNVSPLHPTNTNVQNETKINEITTAIKQMLIKQNCMESILQHNLPWKPERTSANNQQHYPHQFTNGYQGDHSYNANYHPHATHQQLQYDDAKNYVAHNQQPPQ